MKLSLFCHCRGILLSLALLLTTATPLLAQPGGGFHLEIRRNVTPAAYYVHLLFQGAEPADITTVPQQGGIVIRYSVSNRQKEASERGVRFFGSSQSMSSRIGIPPDGDLSRMQRIDKPGWIQLIVPRSRR